MTKPRGRPQGDHVSEGERRSKRHAYLRRNVKAGKPGAEEALHAFRTEWAYEFRRRCKAAETYREEERWDAIAYRWECLLCYSTPLTKQHGRYWPRKNSQGEQKGEGGLAK